MTWIEPLKLETWFVNVFSGTPEIFFAISLLVISTMAGFFRMNMVGLFLMLGTFMLMFYNYINNPMIDLFAIIGGLVIGFWISRMVR